MRSIPTPLPAGPSAPPATRKAAGAIGPFLRRFARNRGAVIGAVILCTIAVVALAADLLFPTDPLRIVATLAHQLGVDIDVDEELENALRELLETRESRDGKQHAVYIRRK